MSKLTLIKAPRRPDWIIDNARERALFAELARRGASRVQVLAVLNGQCNVKALGLVAQVARRNGDKAAPHQLVTTHTKSLGNGLGPHVNGTRPSAPRLTARLMTIDDASRYLGISTRQLWRLIETGALFRVELPGTRRALLDVHDLDALVDRCREGGAGDVLVNQRAKPGAGI